MKDLIHMINAIQEVFTSTGIKLGLELPQIAVIGGQSAGKSSVLECFVGRDFLPRGTGIVTRRPLVLQLYHSEGAEYATFLHTDTRTFEVGDEVRQEIISETERETGHSKGISKRPINLRIFSPNVLNLTLVDLPGMTKVAVGDQPKDIELQIRNMIMEYISQENTIILAVTPANQDLANSDALKLAREVDPEGERTIGVITKLDLMDRGTDARDVLQNTVLPLKKGYIGVVNRSQFHIDRKTSIENALLAEQQFFMDSPYTDIANKQGSKYLQEVLNWELENHIRSKVPEIRSHLTKKNMEVEAKLQSLGYEKNGVQVNGKLVFKLVSQFGECFQSCIDGEGRYVDVDEINHGAIINSKFYKDFAEIINEAFEPSSTLDKDISTVLANIHGTRNPHFLPEKAFDRIVQSLISRYEAPLTKCVAIIRTELDEILNKCLGRIQLEHFSALKKEIRSLVSAQIDKCQAVTVQHLMTHLSAQKAFMNTRHPDFSYLGDNLVPDKHRGRRKSSLVLNSSIDQEIVDVPHLRSNKKRHQESVNNGFTCEAASPDGSFFGSPSPPSRRASKQPRTKKSDMMNNKESTRINSKESTRVAIVDSRPIQDQSSVLKKMVNDYLNITDTTIRDMTPKYIMHSLVLALKDYVREELIGDLLQDRHSPEDLEQLMKATDYLNHINELLAAQETIKQAMIVIDNLTR